MWKRRDLKVEARRAVRQNYWRVVAASFIVILLLGAFAVTIRFTNRSDDNTRLFVEGSAVYIVTDFFGNAFGRSIQKLEENLTIGNSTKGALSPIINGLANGESPLLGILDAVNSFVFKGEIVPGILFLVGVPLYLAYILFVENLIVVGEARFHLENRIYPETKFDRLFQIYRSKKALHISWIMFKRALLLLLWACTIVGGVIQYYAYRMLPYILAENPQISSKDAFLLSRRMMRGHKWRAFLLDLSFLAWHLLSSLTLGLAGIFYVSPYKSATDAALYTVVCRAYHADPGVSPRLLRDPLLAEAREGVLEYPGSTAPATPILPSGDHMRRYSMLDYTMLFLTFSMLGYLYEVIYTLIKLGALVNRGTLYGPWLPLYGYGGVLTLMLFKRFSHNTVATFSLSAVLCGVLEYISGWYLEAVQHTKWWDYTGFFLNINGRVCLEGLIVFGLACSLGIYVLSPTLAALFERIPRRYKLLLTVLLLALFLSDFIYASIFPNTAAGIGIN